VERDSKEIFVEKSGEETRDMEREREGRRAATKSAVEATRNMCKFCMEVETVFARNCRYCERIRRKIK
jgi:hypothetical protein